MKIVASVQAKRGSSRGLVHYIAHSKVDVEREPEKGRELFNGYADSLSVASANNSLKIGISNVRPTNDELHHLVLSFRSEDFRALGLNEKERRRAVKEITRAAMSRLERAVAADRLSWAAAVHLNTANPHVHIALQKQYFTKEIERKFLAKIPHDALPHYALRDGEKAFVPGLLIEAAAERLERLIDRNRTRADEYSKDELMHQPLPESSNQTERNESRRDLAEERDILRRGLLAEFEINRVESRISELIENGDKMRFLVTDPQSGQRRRLSLRDINLRSASPDSDPKSPAETQIKMILIKMLAKEERATATLRIETANTIHEASSLRERYRRNDWKLPLPSFTKDEIDQLQDHYMRVSDLRRFSYLENIRSDLERSREIEPRDKETLGRIAAKKTILDLREKAYKKSYLDFSESRYYRPVEIGNKRVSIAKLDRKVNRSSNSDSSFVDKLKKSFSRFSGQTAIPFEIDNVSLRNDVTSRLDERLAEIKGDQNREKKKAKAFEKILSTESRTFRIHPIHTSEELAELDSLSLRLKLPPAYEKSWEAQRSLIEAGGRDCPAYRKALKADPSLDLNEYKRRVIAGRTLAREIVARVEVDKAREALKTFKNSKRFQRFAVPGEKTDGVTFLSLHDVDLPRRGSILDRVVNELIENREHRRLRRTVTSLANGREHRLEDDLDAAKDILATASRDAKEFTNSAFLGRSETQYRPIFTSTEIAVLETRAVSTNDTREAAKLRRVLESTDDQPSHSLKEILRGFENHPTSGAKDQGWEAVREPDSVIKEEKIKQAGIDHPLR
ncbi:MAG: relaxase MobL [Acidobacteriota bacterium]